MDPATITNILLLIDLVLTSIALGLTIGEAIKRERKRREDDFPFPPTETKEETVCHKSA